MSLFPMNLLLRHTKNWVSGLAKQRSRLLSMVDFTRYFTRVLEKQQAAVAQTLYYCLLKMCLVCCVFIRNYTINKNLRQ
jgi:hypothetical protein